MNLALTAFLAGLCLVGVMAVTGLVWPVINAHLNSPRGGTEISEPKYDRTKLRVDLADAGFAMGDQAYVRIFKREHLLELWMKADDGKFALFRSYEICKYSGVLGPKLAPSRLQHRLPQRARQRTRPHGLVPDGTWRLHVGGLLRDDRPADRRDLCRARSGTR